MQETIPSEEIDVHRLSWADTRGRLFRWRGGLYRGIKSDAVNFYRGLFDKGIISDLIRDGLLVNTELTPLKTFDYPMVVRHHEIPFVSYPPEWSAEMFRDAAFLTLDLQERLQRRDLRLRDSHPWNITFNGPRPVFLDLGSIAHGQESWPAARQFHELFLIPLELFARGEGEITRLLLRDGEGKLIERFNTIASESRRLGVKRLNFGPANLMRGRGCLIPRSFGRGVGSPSWGRQGAATEIQRLKERVQGLEFRHRKTSWSGYFASDSLNYLDPEQWSAKETSTVQLLTELRPHSVLDIGSNRGWFSQYAARNGTKTVAFDIDETAITQLYQDAKREKLDILPLLVDLRDPTPAAGLSNRSMASAIDRFRGDVVLALALVHHLVFKYGLEFGPIVEALAAFTKRALIVEFVPPEDVHVRTWWTPKYSWYRLDNFVSTLQRYFSNIQLAPSAPEPRVILKCLK